MVDIVTYANVDGAALTGNGRSRGPIGAASAGLIVGPPDQEGLEAQVGYTRTIEAVNDLSPVGDQQ